LIRVTEQILLTIPEAAERLRIGRSTAYELIAAGRLETVHIGRACRVPAEALEHFVETLRLSQGRGTLDVTASVGRRPYGDPS
jgi:excisionase family DNA binding protein